MFQIECTLVNTYARRTIILHSSNQVQFQVDFLLFFRIALVRALEVFQCSQCQKSDPLHTLIGIGRSWWSSAQILFVGIDTGFVNTRLFGKQRNRISIQWCGQHVRVHSRCVDSPASPWLSNALPPVYPVVWFQSHCDHQYRMVDSKTDANR